MFCTRVFHVLFTAHQGLAIALHTLIRVCRVLFNTGLEQFGLHGWRIVRELQWLEIGVDQWNGRQCELLSLGHLDSPLLDMCADLRLGALEAPLLHQLGNLSGCIPLTPVDYIAVQILE